MSQSEVIGEVIVRVKPVLDEQELNRIVEQATAAASSAIATAGRANASASCCIHARSDREPVHWHLTHADPTNVRIRRL